MKAKIDKKISIVVIGACHPDFTLYPVLTKLFEIIQRDKIPCGFLEEGPADQTLTEALQLTKNGLEQDQIIKRLFPEILTHYVKNSYGTHLTKSSWEPIARLVKNKVMPRFGMLPSAGVAEQMTLELFRENSYQEEIKLYQKLNSLDVYFAGIDLPTKSYNERLLAAASSHEAYYDNESPRIRAMVDNTFKVISNAFPQGGILFISTGNNHAHRLAANLQYHAQRHDDLNSMITVDAFSYYSDYFKEWKENRDVALKFTDSVDSHEIKEIYKSLSCPSIEGHQRGEHFFIPSLEDRVKKLITCHRPETEQVLVSHSSLFTPLRAHDQLINEVKKYQSQNPEVKINFLEMLEKNDYSLALRNFCRVGNASIVKLLVQHRDELRIDLNATSSNGHTALAWFEQSKASLKEKQEIKSLMEKNRVQSTTVTSNLVEIAEKSPSC